MILEKNKAQEKAINALNGPVILTSCPGSGKTTVIIKRTENLIKNGVDPRKILTITFTKASAMDMKKRFNKNVPVTFSTIHSLCYRILLEEGEITGPNDVLQDYEIKEFFAKATAGLDELKKVVNVEKTIDNIIGEISFVRNNDINIKSYKSKILKPDIFQALFHDYHYHKKELGRIDFDDMLISVRYLFQKDKEILERWQNKYTHIQVDEYQDTNEIQKDIIYMLIDKTKNLFVVGDDDQAIYSFRGASSDIMLNFAKDFKDATVIDMSTNYRSGKDIVDVTKTLIDNNLERIYKNFESFKGKNDNIKGFIEFDYSFTEQEEIDKVIDKVRKKLIHGVNPNEISILYRNNVQSRLISTKLIESKIPFKSNENIRTLYDSYIFKNIEAYCNFSMGKNIEYNFMQILNKPNRYLQQAQFRNLKDYTENTIKNNLSYIYETKYSKSTQNFMYFKAKKNIEKIFRNFGPNKINLYTNPKEMFDRLLDENEINYVQHIKNICDNLGKNPIDEITILNQLEKEALKYDTIKDWFENAYKVIATQKYRKKKNNKNAINISTMHRSKGLEWDVVFVTGINEDVIPFKDAKNDLKAIEDERKLLYVAMTRARNELYLSSSKQESMYIKEILPKIQEINRKNSI